MVKQSVNHLVTQILSYQLISNLKIRFYNVLCLDKNTNLDRSLVTVAQKHQIHINSVI